LCGDVRPGHFAGVATVVTKLLLQTTPDIALFGEKDYQQLQVIRRAVLDLDIDVAIRGVPTIREPDGLAMSSRNAYLSPEQRKIAPVLQQTLQSCARTLQAGALADDVLRSGVDAILKAGFDSVDYLELRAADGLAPLSVLDRLARLLVAARLGKARLIDNIDVAMQGKQLE
jgi:pantoate--beta-alanine ligase